MNLRVWFLRFATVALGLLLIGCAATAPKEQMRLGDFPKVSVEIVRLKDERKAESQTSETVEMVSGQGARIANNMITPDALQVVTAYLNEYLAEKSVAPFTATLTVTRLDVAVIRGKGSPVSTPPGAEGYLGYGGAASGRLMFQAFEDAKAPNFC
jgi:hypothetical protein